MIGNLTSLQTLDLSYNELDDLSEPNVFIPPINLTNFILNNNRFSHLPFEKIVPMQNLKLLDIENNQFSGFNKNLMSIINNGTKLKYAGKIYFEIYNYWIQSCFEFCKLKRYIKISCFVFSLRQNN